MTRPLPSVTGDNGSNGVGALFNYELQWIFRRLDQSDYGIDAQVELVLGGHASGRVLAAQIKAGPSWFTEETSAKDGWVFREATLRLRDYWLDYADPVLLVLYNPATHTAYWQHITPETAVVTGKGFKVVVPASQRVHASAYRALAALARQAPPNGLTELLRDLPARCGNWLLACDEFDPGLARGLAANLVDGRDDPEQTANTAIDGWREEQQQGERREEEQQAVWLAVGEYAIAYGDGHVAAECFLAADQAKDGKSGSGRLRAFAGAMLAATDPDRARALLLGCLSVPDSRLLAAVGLAVLDHGANLGPVPVPPEVTDDPEGAAREPTVQRFLADQCMRVGDWDAAIAYHEQALAHTPNSPDQQVALADALLKRATSISGTLAGSDYRRAAGLAETARAELRRWRGDSVSAAHLLMQIKIMAADETSAFRVALALPEGEATAEEATSPQLALGAARIAYGHGDITRGDTFAAVVEASDDPVWRSNLAANRADAVGATLAEREAAWRAVLAVDQDLGRRVATCSHLAGLGCWPLPELDDIAEAGWLAPGIHEVLHAYALAASGDDASALALLRRLRDSSLPAAEQYAQLLETQGRADDAVQACEDASTRFGYDRLELLALDVLTRAGRTDAFLTKATELLGRSDLPYRLRHAIRVKLIDQYTGRHEWIRCERLAQDGLREITHLQGDLETGRTDALTAPLSAAADLAELRRQYAWMIIINQFNQGQYQRAYETLDELRPEARSAVEATTWFDLHQLQDWTADRAEAALELAESPAQPIELVRRILFTLKRSISSNDPALGRVRERIEQAWQAHADQHVPAPVQISLDQYAALLHAANAKTAPAMQAIWQGTAPVGAMSVSIGRPYLFTLAQRAAGFLPAVNADNAVYRREVEAASAALGHPIAVETTSLFVAAGVLDRWSLIAPEFSDLLIAAPTVYDLLLSQVHARALAQDAVTIGLAADGVQPLVEPVADDVRREVVTLCRAVGDALQACRTVSTPMSANVDEEHPASAAGPWWTGVLVAVTRAVPLYSDDVVVRARAKARGVAAFGTLALLEALARAGRLDLSQTAEVLSTLFEHGVVDLPGAAGLVMNAASQRTQLEENVMMTLARPATWTNLEDQGTELIITLANHPGVQADPHSLASLVYACASGWAAAFSPPEVVVAKLVTVILAFGAGLTVDAARTVVPAAQKIAAAYGADFMPHLRTFLVGTLTDPTGQFRLSTEEADQVVQRMLSDYE